MNIVFLNVFRERNNAKVKLGTLQIGINQDMDGHPLGWFEWQGVNGSNEGGT